MRNRSFRQLSLLALMPALCLCVQATAQRPVQDEGAWERVGGNLLENFHNMYHANVVKTPDEEYTYKIFFFGWATEICNPGYPGCDAIYHARSKDLREWEVYSGEDQWDTTMSPERWKPVITAGTEFYEAWHIGDPSVVLKDGRYYMAFSSTSEPWEEGARKGHPNRMMLAISGATSEDGINWEKLPHPLLIEPAAAQNPETDENWLGDFHRPSLLWDDGRWKLWFDYWHPDDGLCMGYAENAGDFSQRDGFKLQHDLMAPQLENWPNPEVIKVNGRYHSFSDPGGYPPLTKEGISPWRSRQLCEAVSDDGINWEIVGFIAPDEDSAANHVPTALAREVDGQQYIYLFYATQRGGEDEAGNYDYRYDAIRMMRRPVEAR